MTTPLTIEAYAQVMVELFAAQTEGARAVVLRRHQLDEATWQEVDSAYQTDLTKALDKVDESGSALLSRFTLAYAKAQETFSPPISLETFAETNRLIRGGMGLPLAASKMGISVQAYVQGSAHWAQKLARDPNLAARFEGVLRRR